MTEDARILVQGRISELGFPGFAKSTVVAHPVFCDLRYPHGTEKREQMLQAVERVWGWVGVLELFGDFRKGEVRIVVSNLEELESNIVLESCLDTLSNAVVGGSCGRLVADSVSHEIGPPDAPPFVQGHVSGPPVGNMKELLFTLTNERLSARRTNTASAAGSGKHSMLHCRERHGRNGNEKGTKRVRSGSHSNAKTDLLLFSDSAVRSALARQRLYTRTRCRLHVESYLQKSA